MKEPTMTEIEREAKSLRCTILANLGDRSGVLNLDVDSETLAEIYAEMDGAITKALTRHSRPPAGFVRDGAGVDHPKDQYVIDGWVELWAAHVRPELMKTMTKAAKAAAEKERG